MSDKAKKTPKWLELAGVALLLTACASLPAPAEMQMYEEQSGKTDAAEIIAKRYPKLVENAQKHYNLAKEAQDDKEEELLAHHAKVSYLWWSSASARSHADDMAAEREEVMTELVRTEEDLAAAQKQVKLAESAIKRAKDVIALQGQVADSEGANKAREAINGALAALKEAEKVDANVHAGAKFKEAESKLDAATQALRDGKTDKAVTLAGEAETAAASAKAASESKYASTQADREKTAAQQALFEELSGISGVEAAIVEGGVMATIIGSFDGGGVEISADMRTTYDKIADVAKKHPKRSLVIEGHTDSKGSDSKNLQLSDSRAKSVAAYLAGKGVEPGKMSALGKGEQEPVAPNKTKEGRARNRRIEILFATPG
jgi:outer membrane protein OmpA-like peptidoglycan-associated protein